MERFKILIQLDGDAQASVFDAVVAVDTGVDHLLQYRGVEPKQVRDLVHGAIFTRGPKELHNTAVFVGGSDVAHGEALLAEVKQSFFGPMRVSVMLDANGANTTAAAAVLAAARHIELKGVEALVLAATGPVGQRAVQLLAREGATIRVASRSKARAEDVCRRIAGLLPQTRLSAWATDAPANVAAAIDGVQLVIAAGAAGVQLLPRSLRQSCSTLRVAVDLNAVPPAGIEGIDAADKAVARDGATCYGAIGVGATKMKIHKAAISRLFTSNALVLDAEEIYTIGKELAS
jgi:hypothetical protein